MSELIRVEAFAIDSEGAPPEWLHIMPFGPFVVARDGRAFQVTDAAAVASRSELPVLLDWEHESESWFGSTKAAGWGEELRVENGAGGRFRSPGVWMRMHWTPDGAEDVRTKKYRYLSPVLVIDAETRDVQEIVSVALTNRPALRMEQIGQFRGQPLPVGVDAYRSRARETVRIACSAQRQRISAEDFIAQREAAFNADSNNAAVDRACLKAGMTPAQISAARKYISARRAGVQSE